MRVSRGVPPGIWIHQGVVKSIRQEPRPGEAEVDALSFSEGGDKLALGGQDGARVSLKKVLGREMIGMEFFV